jgi:hypothetical protein
MKGHFELRPNIKSVNMEEASIFARKGKRVTADTYGERKASRPVVIVETKAKTHRIVAPTQGKRAEVAVWKKRLRSMNALKGQPSVLEVMNTASVAPAPVKKVKWTMSKVQKVMRLKENGNHRVSMWKLTNNMGVKKYFVSRKAAMLFRDTFNAYMKGK